MGAKKAGGKKPTNDARPKPGLSRKEATPTTTKKSTGGSTLHRSTNAGGEKLAKHASRKDLSRASAPKPKVGDKSSADVAAKPRKTGSTLATKRSPTVGNSSAEIPASLFGTKVARARTIRDPILGDIVLSPLQTAVVDTRIFQRLRYIRQNGLLHFVFPGAVHTRFAHSIGTMRIAGRVFANLFRNADTRQSEALAYIRNIFELAGLLHDVGHCAFSHSIEAVTINGEPLLGTTEAFFDRWEETELSKLYFDVYSWKRSLPIEHEQIGLALVRRIFSDTKVIDASSERGWAAGDLWRDVCALMDGGLPSSSTFKQHAIAIGTAEERFRNEADFSDPTVQTRFVENLLAALHSLISGTLDVDRLDYLVRDSVYCGVPYGKCEVDLLTASLRLEYVKGRFELCIKRKAARAFDDMLWSRYQLFIQALNHKTNVALNVVLRQAIEDAIADGWIKRPQLFHEYLEFTDDLVMSAIFSASLREDLSGKTYTRALIDRQVPLQVAEFDASESREDRIDQIARQFGIDPADVLVGEAKSEFIKGEPLAYMVDWNRVTGKRDIRRLEVSSVVNIPLKYHRIHLFVDRNAKKKRA